MIANETPRVSEGIEESAGRRLPALHSKIRDAIRGVIEHRVDPQELELDLWMLWADGFHTGTGRTQATLEEAQAAADYWYLRANHSPAEIREMQLNAMDDGWRAYWDAGMPTEGVRA